jgi:hypothetical protein
MNDEDLKSIISKYQQKSFELFNQNIVLEVQVESLNKKIGLLESELVKLSTKTKRSVKEEEF